MTEPFVWQLRVYWEDTDAGGVVYHSRYLNFFERARTEWLRSLGVHQSILAEEQGIVFAIRRMEIDFHRSAKLDDELGISVFSVRAGASKIDFRQEMVRGSDGVLLAKASVTAACLDAKTFKPMKMPAWIRAEITDQES